MKKYLLCILFFTALKTYGINTAVTLTDDTAKVNRIIAKLTTIQYTKPDEAEKLKKEIFRISKNLNYDIGLATYYGFKALAHINKLQLDSGKNLLDRASSYIEGNKSITAKNQKSILANTYGVLYQQKQLYDSASIYYFKAIKLAEEVKNYRQQVLAACNLSTVYAFLNDTLKTERYARQGLKAAEKTRDTVMKLRAGMVMINYFAQYDKYDSIPRYSRPLLKMATAIGDKLHEAKALQTLGIYYSIVENNGKAADRHLQKALKITRDIKSVYDEAVILSNIGENFIKQKAYDKAGFYIEQALKLQTELGLIQLKTETMKTLCNLEAKKGNYSKAYEVAVDYIFLKDSLTKRENSDLVHTLETKFQLQHKENTIRLQETSINKKTALNYIFLGSALSLVLILFLTYRNYSHRQKLQKQKINELETEKQLLATQSLLKGQEDERSRLAKDLHDGLGGMLSGVKLQLGAMKGNLILTEENSAMFGSALHKLDQSIAEMRRVAHNMMPEALMRLGLYHALTDYCKSISESQKFVVDTEFHGLEADIDATTSVNIYRIVQELVNNAVKYANATQIIVQVIRNDKLLTVTVEDNGQGFDTALLAQRDNSGLQSVRSRVNYLNGSMDVNSEIGKGTSVYIECTITDHG